MPAGRELQQSRQEERVDGRCSGRRGEAVFDFGNVAEVKVGCF